MISQKEFHSIQAVVLFLWIYTSKSMAKHLVITWIMHFKSIKIGPQAMKKDRYRREKISYDRPVVIYFFIDSQLLCIYF
jgi:hypothetical protein